MAGYTKEFLMEVAMDRFVKCSLLTVEQLIATEELLDSFYDAEGRDKFRIYTGVDSAAIKNFKAGSK